MASSVVSSAIAAYTLTIALTRKQQSATPRTNKAKLTAVVSHALSTRLAREFCASAQVIPMLPIRTARPMRKSVAP